MTLYIIRHGETAFNKKNIVQGSGVDSDLNTVGLWQARLFHEYYKDIRFDAIFASALKRTHQTIAPVVARQAHRHLEYRAELNEISWGINEGKESNQTSSHHFEQLMRDWDSGRYDSRIEGGESAAELHERLSIFIDELVAQHHDKQNVLICTHGRTLLCLLTILNGVPLSQMSAFRHKNTCLYTFHLIDGSFHPELVNDVRHLGHK